jgi:hypothetical protein
MAGTWQPLAHPPQFNASTMLLLTDGTVLCHDEGAEFGGTPHWWKLSPDAFGNYVAGTWSAVAPMPHAPLFFASAILRDGRVFRAGGEYDNGVSADLLAAEIYDPVANSWTVIPTPAGWAHVGDASCCVFPDGRVLIGSIDDNRTAIYDPATNTWANGGSKLNQTSNEETWTLLPNGTILTADCFGHPQTELYVIADGAWHLAGNTPSDLVEDASKEIGPAILLPDGRVFAVGATNHTALYTMGAHPSDTGSWADGPTFPLQQPGQALGAKDAPASLLPNGRVLCVAGPVDGVSGNYLTPTYFFEFDPVAATLTAVTRPPNSENAPFNGRMLLLPTGQVLYAAGTNDIEVYTPDGNAAATWRPHITACKSVFAPGETVTLSGTQLNGLSQAVSYGDDATMATNYPLVRIRNLASNKIVYARTHSFSTLGVATGTAVVSTQFTVSPVTGTGASELVVLANGIASAPLPVNVTAV